MPQVAKSGTVSLSSVNPPQSNTIVGLLAGAAIANGDTCYINAAGTIAPTNGTAATAAALYDGIYLGPAPVAIGEPVTLHRGVVVRYGAGLTPGTRVFVSATAGTIADAATTGGTVAIGNVVDATRVYFFHPTR